MDLIMLIAGGVIAVIAAAFGVSATIVILLRDGYRARPFQSSYDSRLPR
ncbi:hypothetical protein [Pseudoclavibacter helvolus]